MSSPAESGPSRLPVSGEVDMASVPTLLVTARRLLDARPSTLLVDLGDVSFIDSSGLGALVQIRNYAHDVDATVVLDNVGDATQRLLRLSGLNHVFEIRPHE